MRNEYLERNRQESIRVWADSQRQALHEASKNTPVNQPVPGLGTGAGGSFTGQLPLESVQITTLTNEEDGKWVIHVVNHTTGQTYQTDSGYDDTWSWNGQWGAADGYAILNLYKSGNGIGENLYRFLIISPEGQITSTISSGSLSFPDYDYNIYYGGGISVLLANDSNRTAVFHYFYNGQMWSHTWSAGTWYGFEGDNINDYNWDTSKNGEIWISTRVSNSNHNAEIRVFGPGVNVGSSLNLGLFTQNNYNAYTTGQYNDEGLPMNTDGTLSNNGKSDDSPWVLYRENVSNNLTSLYLMIDSFSDSWDCLEDIQNALSNYSTAIDIEALYIDDSYNMRSGNDIELIIVDRTNDEYWSVVLDLTDRSIRLVMPFNELHTDIDWEVINKRSTLNNVWLNWNYDDDQWNFEYSNNNFKAKVLWKDSTFETFTIPRTYNGENLALCTYTTLSDSSNEISFIGFVDSPGTDFYKITVTKGQVEPVFTLIPGFNGIDTTSMAVVNCYNDIKNEWFTKVSNRRANSIKYLIINGTTGAILDNKTINKLEGEGGYDLDLGEGYVPVMLHLQLAGIRKIWCLDYNNYTWNLAIDTTTTPTGDSQFITDLETYDAGYSYYFAGSRWLFIDPDFPRSWIITSKYGAVFSDSIPIVGGPWPNNIGQVYAQSYQVETETTGATSVSTGQYNQYNVTESNCNWFNPVNDRFIYVGYKPGDTYYIDVFTGPEKVLTLKGEPYWSYNDVTYERAVD